MFYCDPYPFHRNLNKKEGAYELGAMDRLL